MDKATLKHFNRTELLKYLAYLQVLPENSAHTQALQELQNLIQSGEDLFADDTLWTGLDDMQTWLFAANSRSNDCCDRWY